MRGGSERAVLINGLVRLPVVQRDVSLQHVLEFVEQCTHFTPVGDYCITHVIGLEQRDKLRIETQIVGPRLLQPVRQLTLLVTGYKRPVGFEGLGPLLLHAAHADLFGSSRRGIRSESRRGLKLAKTHGVISDLSQYARAGKVVVPYLC